MILKVDGAIYNSGTTEQLQAIDWVNANQKLTLRCDSYALMQYPVGHFLTTRVYGGTLTGTSNGGLVAKMTRRAL